MYGGAVRPVPYTWRRWRTTRGADCRPRNPKAGRRVTLDIRAAGGPVGATLPETGIATPPETGMEQE